MDLFEVWEMIGAKEKPGAGFASRGHRLEKGSVEEPVLVMTFLRPGIRKEDEYPVEPGVLR